jgi:hypothetical protein
MYIELNGFFPRSIGGMTDHVKEVMKKSRGIDEKSRL